MSTKPAPKERSPRAKPYVAVVVGIGLTAAAIFTAHRYIETRELTRFSNAVRATEDRISARFDAYLALLRATRALMTSTKVTPSQFRAFAQMLELEHTYRGIQGIGYTRRVPWAEREALEAEMRAHGEPTFTVWPQHARPEVHSITMLEPQDARNRAALGYDMFTEATRRDAMERARDTGHPSASGRVTLVQEIDEGKQAGFLLYVPVYAPGAATATVEERRRALLGFVYSPFRVHDLFEGIFGTETQPRVAFTLRDSALDNAEPFYRSEGWRDDARYVERSQLEIAGRTWQLDYVSLPTFETSSHRWVLPLIAFGGLAGTFLAFLLARARARFERELRLHSLILARMSDGVSVSAEDGTILYTNPAEDEMFGYEPGELIGKPVTVQNTYPPDENERIVADVIAQLREKGSFSGEFSNVRKDGTAFTTAARITALDLGDQTVWVAVQRDISDRKRIETERAALLEREQAARVAAEDANRAKDDFLAVLGHELRNPLAPIVTTLELMDRRYGRERLPEHDVIERQVRHLRRMVDDLLDVSAVARGKVALRKQRIEISTIVRQAVEVAEPLLEERRHVLRVDVPDVGLVIDADEARIVQVISNLLTNAAKYTDPGGTIEVHADAFEGDVRVRVRDTGIGMEPSEIERMFQLFAQGERRLDQARGGMGIGLSLARGLVSLHGGTLSASSEGRGQGSELTLRLPRVEGPVEPVTAPRTNALTAARTPHRILVVDDNRDAAEMLADLLRTAGHEVELAFDAPQAFDILQRWTPEVAILDIGLPVMDGYELASKLDVQPRPLMIALTGYGGERDRSRSEEAGFDHHLVKPVSPAALLTLIEQRLTARADA